MLNFRFLMAISRLKKPCYIAAITRKNLTTTLKVAILPLTNPSWNMPAIVGCYLSFPHNISKKTSRRGLTNFSLLLGITISLLLFGMVLSLTKSRSQAIALANKALELEKANIGLRKEVMERKQAEESLKESEERLRNLIETTSDWIWEVDKNGVYTYVSPKIRDILGYDPEEIIGKTPFDLMPHEEADRVSKIFSTIVASQESFDCLENINLHKNGQPVVLETSGVPIFDAGGEFCGYRGIDRNITERKQLEKQLRESQKMEAVGVLAGGLAHDFNTLIGIISGYGDMLRDHLSEGSRPRNYLEELMDAAHHAKELVKQLMGFARSEKGERKPLQLALSIEESLGLLRSSLRAPITIQQNIEAKSDTVLADSNQIQQVIMNLVINAGWAIGDKMGELGVSLTEVEVDAKLADLKEVSPGPYLRLSVSDTGRGMDSELMEHIFEPFYTTKKVGEGSGLGLSVVHGIVKSHGGFVTVDSEPAKGSTFHVYLPKVQEKDVVIEEGGI